MNSPFTNILWIRTVDVCPINCILAIFLTLFPNIKHTNFVVESHIPYAMSVVCEMWESVEFTQFSHINWYCVSGMSSRDTYAWSEDTNRIVNKLRSMHYACARVMEYMVFHHRFFTCVDHNMEWMSIWHFVARVCSTSLIIYVRRACKRFVFIFRMQKIYFISAMNRNLFCVNKWQALRIIVSVVQQQYSAAIGNWIEQ